MVLKMGLAGEKLHEHTGNCQSYSCAAHLLQLCIEEGLRITVFSQALEKLVTHFRHSALATAELKRQQETMSIEPKKLLHYSMEQYTVHDTGSTA